MEAKSFRDYVAPVPAHVVAAEYSKLSSIYQVKNLSAYARQMKIIQYLTKALRVRQLSLGHVGCFYNKLQTKRTTTVHFVYLSHKAYIAWAYLYFLKAVRVQYDYCIVLRLLTIKPTCFFIQPI